MSQCIVIGKANVGKTLFVLNFTNFLGISEPMLDFDYADGKQHRQAFTTHNAILELTSEKAHHTLGLQHMDVTLPGVKGQKQFTLTDTCGLAQGIHGEALIRRAMAQTIAALQGAKIILHMMDAHHVANSENLGELGEVDWEIAQYGGTRSGYGILANKMDLIDAGKGLLKIRKEFPLQAVIPISALQKRGFREVKHFVWRHL